MCYAVLLTYFTITNRLNAIVEFFRTEEGNETKCVGELHRVIAHLEHLAEVHLSQPNEATEAGNVEVFFGLTRALDMNADKMVVELTYVKQTVANAVRGEGTTNKCTTLGAKQGHEII